MSRPYLSKHRLARIGDGLTGRDLDILTTLKSVRLATASQLERLHFFELAASGRDRQRRAVLARLVGVGLLERSSRRVGGERAGSAGFTYWLSAGGWRFVEPDHPARRRRGEVGYAYRNHALAITELLVRAIESERQGQLVLNRFDAEPLAWKSFAAGRKLKPDAYAQIERKDGYVDHWFVEVDRSTESTIVLQRKCETYLDAFHAGIDDFGTMFPAVLFSVPDIKRAEQLLRIVERMPDPSTELFYIAIEVDAVDQLVAGIGGAS